MRAISSLAIILTLALQAPVVLTAPAHETPALTRSANPPPVPPVHRAHRRGGCLAKMRDGYQVLDDDGDPGPVPDPACLGHGLYINPDTCLSAKYSIVQSDIISMGRLLQAALNGIDQPGWLATEGNPYPYFFGEGAASTKVLNILSTALIYADGITPSGLLPIQIDCGPDIPVDDEASTELAPPPAFLSGGNSITLTDAFFLKRAELNPPCMDGLTTNGITGIGAQSQAQSLLHVLTSALDSSIQNYALGSYMCNNLLLSLSPNWHAVQETPNFFPGHPPADNADSYAHYAALAYDLGLQSLTMAAPTQTCLELWDPPFHGPEAGFIGENVIGPW